MELAATKRASAVNSWLFLSGGKKEGRRSGFRSVHIHSLLSRSLPPSLSLSLPSRAANRDSCTSTGCSRLARSVAIELRPRGDAGDDFAVNVLREAVQRQTTPSLPPSFARSFASMRWQNRGWSRGRSNEIGNRAADSDSISVNGDERERASPCLSADEFQVTNPSGRIWPSEENPGSDQPTDWTDHK